MARYADNKTSDNRRPKGRGNRSKKDKPKFNRKARARYKEREDAGAEVESKFTDTPDNDPRWYGVGNPLITGTYNFPQFTPLGSELNLYSHSNKSGVMPDYLGHRIPGVMTYNWSPVFPSEQGSGSLNSAFANMFSYVRHANSGHANYSMGSLACYCIAATGIVAWMANLRRLYGFMHNFDGVNTYYPKVVVEAMGFDYEDLVTNLPQLYAYINYATAKCSAIWLPITNTLPFRWEFMNSEIYQDSSTIKPQTYFYRMDGLYVWMPEASLPGEAGLYYVKLATQNNCKGFTPCTDPRFSVTETSGSDARIANFLIRGTFWNQDAVDDSVKSSDFTGAPRVWPVPGMTDNMQHPSDTHRFYGTAERLKFQGIKYFTEWLINNFINDEDRGIIAGDLLKAYGAENMYKWPTIPEFYTVVPKFSPELDMQFRNTRTPNWNRAVLGQTILDDGGSLTVSGMDVAYTGFSDMCEIDHVLTFDKIADEADLAIATRNVPFTDGKGGILTAGTEVVTRFQLWYKSNNANSVVGADIPALTVKFGSFLDAGDLAGHTEYLLCKLITFNTKPLIYLIKNDSDNNYVSDLWFDADNYFPYTLQNARMVNTAVSFEYGVPLAVGVKK
jgi:hypothetical protein